MCRIILIAFCVLNIIPPAFGTARAAGDRRILLLTDPNDSTSAASLLEAALIADLKGLAEIEVLLLRPQPVGKASRLRAQGAALMTKAKTKFDMLDLDNALKNYGKAVQRCERAAAASGELDNLPAALGMLSAVFLLYGQEKRAENTLRRLFTIAPTFALDETIYNPAMSKLAERIQQDARNAPSVGIQVATEPPGAVVFLDDRLVGSAPITVNATKGRHYIRALYKGYEPQGVAVDAHKTPSAPLALRLRPQQLSPRLRAQAAAAIAAIDAPFASDEAKSLARAQKASDVIILASTGGGFKLVRYDLNGNTPRYEAQVVATISSFADAQGTVAQLKPLATSSVAAASASVSSGSDASAAAPKSSTATSRSTMTPAKAPTSPATPKKEATPRPSAPAKVASNLLRSNEAERGPVPSWRGIFAIYGLYGAAAVLAGTGTYFAFQARSDYTELNRLTITDGQIDHSATTDQIEGRRIAHDGERHALLADILYGTAILSAAAGAIMHLLLPADAPPRDGAAPFTLRPAPNGVQVTF